MDNHHRRHPERPAPSPARATTVLAGVVVLVLLLPVLAALLGLTVRAFRAAAGL